MEFKGASVDEECLLETAKNLGVCWFQTRDSEGIEIIEGNKTKRFELIREFEFDADRRAMSIVVRDPSDPENLLCFVKGADVALYNMMKLSDESDKQNLEKEILPLN